MQRIDGGEIRFSPHDLINFMQCRFVSWMDRCYLDNRALIRDEADEGTQILQKKGIEHEVAYLENERRNGKSIIEIADGPDAFQRTLAAMREGPDIIYQAVLRHGNFGGIADFLYRCPGQSQLGNYHYDVRDTKLAKKTKPEFVIQLCCYAELLESIQGRLPEHVGIALGSGQYDVFRTQDYYYYYRTLKKGFLQFIEDFDCTVVPDDIRVMPFSRWNTEAKRLIEERDLLSQVANIQRSQIGRLKASNISTVESLASSTLHFVPGIGVDTFGALKEQAQLQIASRGSAVPKFSLLPPDPKGERRGLALLPPADPLDVWFDMEGYPHIEGGLEYLFGATHLSASGQEQFIDFWAHDRTQEKLAFEQFVDWIYFRWQSNPGMHVYHYASYEVSAMRRLMGRHGTREREIDDLLRNEVFVDLFQIVRHSLRIGEPRYSIKNVEHLYRGKREGDVSNAVDSIVFYDRWSVDPDGATWETSKILANIREYNWLDCQSTMELTNWLRERQLEYGIDFRAKPPKDEKEVNLTESANVIVRRNAELAEEILRDSNEKGLVGEPARLHTLLAHLLQFHQREDKPTWWSIFDRLSMMQEELMFDADCLGGLMRTATAPRESETTRAKWRYYEYAFDSAQETKITVGDTCCLSYDQDRRVEIDAIDRERGLVTLKMRQEQAEPNTPLGLIPYEIFRQKALQEALYEVIHAWRVSGTMPDALNDFLLRQTPRINGRKPGDPLLGQDGDFADALLQVVLQMQRTTLCMQGPPGSGKTTSAAKLISGLLKRGLKVGITSNSHKSIEHLLVQCAQVATSLGITVMAAKVGSDGDGSTQLHPAIQSIKEKLKVFPLEKFNLVGGTAFAFCIPEAAEAFDYLFVDEAGQMSVANLVAVSRCARNIILLGDQMQLEQPVQGFHPGESGTSILEYYMQDLATIPPERGIFLGLTHRMHPAICSLISNAVYEGKLESAEPAFKRVLSLPSHPGRISKPAGVIFVPVEHDGNTQGSEEEAKVVKEIVGELLQLSWFDGKLSRKLTADDILVVAPYNMQVRLIRDHVPSVRVGSVDKFQGQEAPVVILSMAASDANASPRGISFLFNKNRLNVALSRAKTAAIVVGSPRLAYTECSSLEQIAMANFFCRITEEGLSVPAAAEVVS